MATQAFGALRHRSFRLFFFGQLVSVVGWWMHRVAQPWLVLSLSNSALLVGTVSALGTLPVTVLSLFGGVVADRFPRRTIVLVTQAAAMAVALALAAVVLLDVVRLWHVMAAATMLGVIAAFDIPGRQSFLVELVGERDLMSGIALNSSAFNAARVIGPAIGGVLIGIAGVGMCFLLNGISSIAVLVALIMIRVPSRPAHHDRHRGPPGVREGLGLLRTEPRVRTLLLTIAVMSVFGFPFQVLMPVFARESLGMGAGGYGALMAAAGGGAMVGALGLAGLGHRLPRGRIVAGGSVAFGVLIALLSAFRSVPVLLVVLVLTGFAMIAHTATTNTLLQTLVPDHLRGRIMAMYTFAFIGLAPLGSVGAGAVADRVGVRVVLAVGGTVCAGVSAVAMWRTPTLRRTL